MIFCGGTLLSGERRVPPPPPLRRKPLFPHPPRRGRGGWVYIFRDSNRKSSPPRRGRRFVFLLIHLYFPPRAGFPRSARECGQFCGVPFFRKKEGARHSIVACSLPVACSFRAAPPSEESRFFPIRPAESRADGCIFSWIRIENRRRPEEGGSLFFIDSSFFPPRAGFPRSVRECGQEDRGRR